jgi:hypothetical protein
MRRASRPCRVALLIGAMALALPAGAEETDFLPDSVAWNGTSELSDVAAGMRLRVELLELLDWAQLPARASLLLIYPQTEVDPDDVVAFLERGGSLLIADDFGGARPLLQRLGIERHDGAGIRAARTHDGNPHLPIASAGPARHPLNAGLGEVVANHPSYFTSRLPTLLGFGPAQQLVVAGQVGKGHFIALADPSVLINSMLRFEGNLTFATNLVRHIAPQDREESRMLLATGHFRVKGHVSSSTVETRSAAQRFMTEYNTFLGHLNDFALTEPALRALAFVCGSLTLVGLLLFVPLPRRALDGHWLRPQGAPRWGFEDQVHRFGRGRLAGATYPAVVLREELEDRLAQIFAAPGPISTIAPDWVVGRARQLGGVEAARVCDSTLKQIPLTMRADESPRARRISRKDLAQAYELGRQLLTLLGQDPLPALSPQMREKTHARDR